MDQNNRDLLLRDLSARLPYGVKGKVKADGVDPHKYDIEGFPLEITFDVDVELQRIDVSNGEIFVSTFDNNEELGNYIEECQTDGFPWTIEEFTPYLRPISSMTEEEFFEYRRIKFSKVTYRDEYKRIDVGKYHNVGIIPIDEYLDWLNAHHFDYRGLIEKGLAIEATEDRYKLK